VTYHKSTKWAGFYIDSELAPFETERGFRVSQNLRLAKVVPHLVETKSVRKSLAGPVELHF
jgi:hypothetical protein